MTFRAFPLPTAAEGGGEEEEEEEENDDSVGVEASDEETEGRRLNKWPACFFFFSPSEQPKKWAQIKRVLCRQWS